MTQLAKMGIDSKFVELTADVVGIILQNFIAYIVKRKWDSDDTRKTKPSTE